MKRQAYGLAIADEILSLIARHRPEYATAKWRAGDRIKLRRLSQLALHAGSARLMGFPGW